MFLLHAYKASEKGMLPMQVMKRRIFFLSTCFFHVPMQAEGITIAFILGQMIVTEEESRMTHAKGCEMLRADTGMRDILCTT